MTSTGPQPELLNEIEALFSWNPPPLIPIRRKWSSTSTSTTTRPPFYDKHFSSNLVLKRVERLPSLVQDLAKNVDKALDAALKTLPPLDGFITAELRESYDWNLGETVADERAVGIFYNRTTAIYCSAVASTLALHPSASFSRWRTLLSWRESGPSSVYPFMVGFLCFMGEGTYEPIKTRRAAIVESMETKNRRIFEEMRESMSPLATWTIKNTTAGPDEVMTAVPYLGKFSWTICTASECLSNPKHQKEREKTARVVVGPDAQVPPWSFPADPLKKTLDPENCDKEIAIQHIDESSANLAWPVNRRVTRSAARSGSSALPLPPQSASRSSERGSPMKDKGKKRKRDEEEAYQDQHGITAQSLVQQAWTQAVRVDGTVIVIHSGNHELVCVRHRGSQTLYVSDVIEPPTCANPGHDGSPSAAPTVSQPKSPGGDFIGDDKDRDDDNRGSGSGRKDGRGHREVRRRGRHGVGKRGGSRGSTRRNDPAVDESVAIEKTIHMASNCDVVLLYFQYDVYDSPVPASFLRSAPLILAHTGPFSPRPIHTYKLEECLTIVLTSEVGWGATGVVHRGTLKPEISYGAVPLDVVVKLAFNDEQRVALRSEYEAYRRLRSKGVDRGIATVLGFFDDSEDGACAIVMLYAGVPLFKEPQHILSVSERKSALSTMESIHRAGILHGDIREENILMGDSGVTIIDFGHSEQCDDQKAKDKEYGLLRYFLRKCRVSKPLT